MTRRKMRAYTKEDITVGGNGIFDVNLPEDWQGSFIDILEMEEKPAEDRLAAVSQLAEDPDLCEDIDTALIAIEKRYEFAESEGRREISDLGEVLGKGGKTYTIKDIRDLDPCYEPGLYLLETWMGTVDEILLLDFCPAEDRLWVVMQLEEKLMGQKVGSQRWRRVVKSWIYLTELRQKERDEESFQIARIIGLLKKKEPGKSAPARKEDITVGGNGIFDVNLPEDWQGSFIDILEMEEKPAEDRLAAVSQLAEDPDLC
ncbi:MAG: hypothetical protein GY765_06415, partial [bacterium]|nr:hypothetical protein [bacterium]